MDWRPCIAPGCVAWGMELTPMRYFVAMARAGTMSKAAEELGVTQPALSAMMKKLEAEVGARLLDRTRRGVELTEAGRVFLAGAEEALRRVEGAVKSVRELVGLEHGSIRLGGGATAIAYLLPRVLSEFRRQHREIRVYIREAGSRAVAEAVLSGELDLGVVTLPVGSVGADDLVKVPLVHDELRLIVPPGHRLSEAKSFRWRDVEGESLVAFEAGTAVRRLIDRAIAEAGVSLEVAMELRSIDSIRRMVGAGVGVGFVSRFALGGGEGLTCRDGRLTREIALVRRRGGTLSPAAAALEVRLRKGIR